MIHRIKDIIRQIRITLLHLICGYMRVLSVPTGTTVFVAPHPDDEVIGCGGLIQRLLKQGGELHIVIMTAGEGSHQNCCNTPKEQIKEVRRRLCTDIDTSLGLDGQQIHMFGYPDGGIQTEHEETMRLQTLINKIKPDVIFVPHWGEGWPDHVNTRQIIRNIANHHTTIYEYCVWMWYYNVWRLDWRNARILSMTKEEHEKKLKAVDDYVTPQAPCGNPWSGVLPTVFLHANKWNKELYFVCQ